MPLLDNLRLRITVQRHGVPEVKLVWPCVRSHDLTVSKLLAEINEVIPLETCEWGLEDYVLELTDGSGESYECLHFQQVPQILKNDDQVIIRYLQGEDLKRRRLSGRHQISSDGKHLVDGLVFGRPWLRTPRDRPALELPPRKRARTTQDYDDDEYLHCDDERQPRLLTTGSEASDDDESFHDFEQDQDADESVGDDTDDTEENQEELASELRLLVEENQALDHDVSSDGMNALDAQDPSKASAIKTSGLDLGSLDNIVALRAAFPLTPVTAIEAELLQNHKDIRKTYESLKKSNHSVLGFDDLMDRYVAVLLGTSELPAESSLGHGSLLPESGTTRPLIEEVIDGNSGDAANEEPVRHRSLNDAGTQVHLSSDSDSDEEDSSNSDSDDEGTSDSDGSSSDSSSDPSSDSSSDSSGSDDNGRIAEAGGEGAINDGEAGPENSRERSPSGTSESSGPDACWAGSDSSDNGAPINEPIAPDFRCAKAELGSKEVIKSPFVPTPARLTKTQKRNARRRKRMAEQKLQCDALACTLEERKEALLRTMAQKWHPTEDELALREALGAGGADASQNDDACETASVTRPSRVDMDAGRRLVFGALGLKTPKTKADEEKIKQALMKDVRPLSNARLAQSVTADESKPAALDKVDQSWRRNLNYRAVECVQSQVSLSEPPFPFKQRWDPQQRVAKGKKRKRQNTEDLYEDGDSGLYVDEEDATRSRSEGTRGEAFPSEFQDDEAIDDLAALPADLNILPALQVEAVKEGMIITWKQMVMSKATRWQPQIAQRTGLVLPGTTEEEVHVQLAARDRESKKKTFDHKTGQRIYDKFEVPDMDSEDGDGEDDGERLLSWAELMDPRVLRDEGQGETMGPVGEGSLAKE